MKFKIYIIIILLNISYSSFSAIGTESDSLYTVNKSNTDSTQILTDSLVYNKKDTLDNINSDVKKSEHKNRLFKDIRIEYFNEFNKILLLNSLSYARKYKKDLYSLKISFVNSFIDQEHSNKDYIYEIESYQVFSTKTYCWLNYQFSEGIISPTHKFSTQIYQPLENGFVPNIGFRYMKFKSKKSSSKIYLYTFGCEKYFRGYWISMNNYLYYQNRLIYSFGFEARKYFNNEQSFLSIIFGMGNFNSNYNKDELNNFTDNNAFFGTSIKHIISKTYYFKPLFIIDFNTDSVYKITGLLSFGILF